MTRQVKPEFSFTSSSSRLSRSTILAAETSREVDITLNANQFALTIKQHAFCNTQRRTWVLISCHPASSGPSAIFDVWITNLLVVTFCLHMLHDSQYNSHFARLARRETSQRRNLQTTPSLHPMVTILFIGRETSQRRKLLTTCLLHPTVTTLIVETPWAIGYGNSQLQLVLQL